MRIITCLGCSKSFSTPRLKQIYCNQPACQRIRKANNRHNFVERAAIKPIQKDTKINNMANCEQKMISYQPLIDNAVNLIKNSYEARVEALQKENEDLKNELRNLNSHYITLKGVYRVERERGEM